MGKYLPRGDEATRSMEIMKCTKFKCFSIGSLTESEIKKLKDGELITLSNGHRLKCYLTEKDPRSSKRCYPVGRMDFNCYFSNYWGRCTIPCIYKKRGRRKCTQVMFTRVRGEGKKK